MAVNRGNKKQELRSEEIENLFRGNLHRIVPVDLEKEMRKSFIDYAMSVISDRALPDIRDGLKPVHRRILYALYAQGFTPDKAFRKCATTVGYVLGKFHPHGDAAVYDAMVRLAQDFSMRHPLVDGYGNFGSRDGDPAAAYRYTEARLQEISMEMLRDIHKDAVDFKPNYDEHEMEPVVLPSRFPNLLVNGSMGIAVGMATNIPPHNLREAIDASIYLMKNKEATLDEIMKIMPGPDFPTAGTIMGNQGIREVYSRGRGRIVVRAKTVIEDMDGQRQRIVVSSLPYMVNKARLIERIAELNKDKKIDGVSFVRDESDRNEEVRIVIELKRDANAELVLNQLYKQTQMQDSFNANILALVPDALGRYEPKTLSLLECLSHYVNHQKDVVLRRTKFDLEKALARQHLLEGLKIAFVHIDEIIETIKKSANSEEAKLALSARFGFSERQAQHIGEMRLFRLTNLEQVKIETEYNEVCDKIAAFKLIIENDWRLIEVVEEELIAVREEYGDERRTLIDYDADIEIEDESLIKEENIVMTLTRFGYVKRQSLDNYRSQRRGGKGSRSTTTRDEDEVQNLLIASTHDIYLFLTDKGRMFKLKGYQVPDASRQARGTAIVNLLKLEEDEKVKTIITVKNLEDDRCLLFATSDGTVKRTALSEFVNINKNGIRAINLRENSRLVAVSLLEEGRDIILCTRKGQSLRFNESQLRKIGRNSIGVRGISLREGDEVVGMSIVDEACELLIVTTKAYGKRTAFDHYTVRNRGGIGLKTYNVSSITGDVAQIATVSDADDVLLLTDDGTMIRFAASEISSLSRQAKGVRMMNTDEAMVVDLSLAPHEEQAEEEAGEEAPEQAPEQTTEQASEQTSEQAFEKTSEQAEE